MRRHASRKGECKMREGLKLMTSDSITLPIRRRRFDNIRCIGMMLTLMLVLGSMNACSVKEELSEAPVTSDQSVDDKLSDTALELKTLEARERFDADIERLAIEVLENSPLHASFVLGDLKRHGLMHLAAELDHVGAKQSEKDLRMAEKQLTRLHETDYMLLDEMQKDIYRMAEFNLRYSIALNSHPYAFNLISPSSGIQISIPLTLMQIEFESVEEIDAFVARVKELPRLLDEVIAYEQERFALGYGMPGRMYEEAAVQIDAMLGPVDEFMMYRSFSDKVDAYEGLENAIKEEYKENYYSIVENDLYPAFERVKDQAVAMQESELSGSVSEWPNGKEYYETLIGYKTSEELMEIDELRAWSDESRKKYDGLFWEIFEENPDLFDLDFETLFDEYDTIEEVYETVDKAYESQFKDYGVDLASENIIPDYLEDYLALGFYFPVTVDGEDYGNMFLQKDEYESITLDTLLLYFHENIPGHHLYFSYIASSDDPLLRKMNEYRSLKKGGQPMFRIWYIPTWNCRMALMNTTMQLKAITMYCSLCGI